MFSFGVLLLELAFRRLLGDAVFFDAAASGAATFFDEDGAVMRGWCCHSTSPHSRLYGEPIDSERKWQYRITELGVDAKFIITRPVYFISDSPYKTNRGAVSNGSSFRRHR